MNLFNRWTIGGLGGIILPCLAYKRRKKTPPPHPRLISPRRHPSQLPSLKKERKKTTLFYVAGWIGLGRFSFVCSYLGLVFLFWFMYSRREGGKKNGRESNTFNFLSPLWTWDQNDYNVSSSSNSCICYNIWSIIKIINIFVSNFCQVLYIYIQKLFHQ